jgi:dynein-related subfamily AAA family protein
MANKEAASLIPMADTYLDNGMNVLLIGPHGTGKTQSLLEMAMRRNLKLKYYSCSTLDPFTDLVGVPVPKHDPELGDYLKMIRPLSIDEAELVFFDEFNRADPKTLNAIFEIIQFRSINGEPLPNLKACWAAMNPPDDEQNYQVEAVDPALLDRFDLYIEINPKPSVAYMARRMPEPIAIALKLWWDDHDRLVSAKKDKDKSRMDYVSPRRLEKLGLVWEATNNVRSLKQALPPGGNFDAAKLISLLEAASEGKAVGGANNIGAAPNPEFTYTTIGLANEAAKVAKYLRENQNALETHREVARTLSTGAGGNALVTKYGIILDALAPSVLEGFVAGLPQVKVNQMRQGFRVWFGNNRALAKTCKRLHAVLDDGNPGSMPDIS